MHGWIHENNSVLGYKDERDLMLRAFDTLTDCCGTAPVGFRSANWDIGPSTMQIVKELGLLYDSSMMADEACYEILLDGEPSGVVEVPVEWLRDDAVYLMFNRKPTTRPYTTPEQVFDIFRRELDVAWDEGGLFQLVMHPFVIGYRSRLWILEELDPPRKVERQRLVCDARRCRSLCQTARLRQTLEDRRRPCSSV